MRYNVNQFNLSNRWSGDNGSDDFTESLWCWKSGKKHVVKWAAEGAVKWGFFQSILQRVGIRQLPGYVGILQSARVAPWIKVAPRIVLFLFVLDRVYCSVEGVFALIKAPLTWNKSRELFPVLQGGRSNEDAAMAAFRTPDRWKQSEHDRDRHLNPNLN